MSRDTPSKSTLLDRRQELTLVEQGAEVLDQQRERLAQEMMQMLHQCEQIQQRFMERFRLAAEALRYAVIRHGRLGLRQFRFPVEWPAQKLFIGDRRYGISWLKLTEAVEQLQAPHVGEGWDISLELEQAVTAWYDVLRTGVELSVALSNLHQLTKAFERTQRRVNALENVLYPELRSSVQFIENALDEMEREEQVRARFAKRRREKQAAAKEP